MNKRITTALLASGLMLGGIGTAQMALADDTQSVDGQGATVQVQDGTEEPGRPAPDGERRHGCGRHLDAAAEAIGIDVETLRAGLDAGQTIAEVAEDNGVDPQDVIDAMVAASDARLDEKVEAGRLTAEEAEARLAEKASRIEDRVFGVDDAGVETPADTPTAAA